jgi:hypothetical protein
VSLAARDCIVVDVNVLAVAEDLHSDATAECRAACVGIARRIQAGVTVAVDTSDLILREYLRVLRRDNRDGLGAKLAISLWRRRRDTAACHQVDISPAEEPPRSFEEVPAALRDFDNDDQMYFAVVFADGSGLQLYQALDGEWWDRRADLAAAGLDVQFLCAADLLKGRLGASLPVSRQAARRIGTSAGLPVQVRERRRCTRRLRLARNGQGEGRMANGFRIRTRSGVVDRHATRSACRARGSGGSTVSPTVSRTRRI